LTYTKFEYSNLNINKSSFTLNDSIQVQVTVKNVGNVEAKEVVQLFVSRMYSNVTPYSKQLKKFQKINLKPQEEKTINFTISAKDIIFVNEKNEWVNSSGQYELEINGSVSKFEFLK
jgi:beta-glucosidase